jgi:3-demethoxyubiquinol 3-hydroxylase
MRIDEIEHGQAATDAGGAILPEPMQKLMKAHVKSHDNNGLQNLVPN